MTPLPHIMTLIRHALLLPVVLLWAGLAHAATINDFLGTYSGSADIDVSGELERRDMSATIARTKTGFTISWTSIIARTDGRTTEKTYTIEFVPSDRDNIFGSAMQRNVFGKSVPLDPLKGEPFVWARLEADTLTVFSLFINESGDYEMQEYHRTLADGGLDLEFRRMRDGIAEKEIRTFLKRTD